MLDSETGSNENLSVRYPFNGDIFLFSCNIYLLLQSHNLFVMRLNKVSENKKETGSEYFPGANSIKMSYNAFKRKPLTGQINCSAFVSYEELWRSRRVLSASAYGLDG